MPSRSFLAILEAFHKATVEEVSRVRKTTRHDTVSWAPPEGERYVTSEDASKALLGRNKGEAEAARQRMLERRGLAGSKSEPAAEARQRMIDRKQK